VFAIGVVAVVALVAAVVRAADMQPRPAPAAATAAARREAPATAAPGSCAQCHADVSSHQVLHPKVAECASCHVQAPNAAHQFEEKQCLTCHQVATPKDTFVHGPVAAGDCLTCHTAHGAEEPQLLRAFGPELCESCHVEMKALRAEKRFTHSPVKEDCATCHNPHASPARYQLRDPSA
jgi:predicted CXXCH cytochrome family protein